MATREIFFFDENYIDSRKRGSIANTNLEQLPPELDEAGNVEYKYKLTDVSKRRLKHLTTQLSWRISQGNGTAIYQIGVLDDGALAGLVHADMTATLSVLQKMTLGLDAVSISNVQLRKLDFSPAENDGSIAPTQTLKTNQLDSTTFDTTAAVAADIDEPKYVAEVVFTKSFASTEAVESRITLIGDHNSGKSSLIGCLAHKIQDNGKGKARLGILQHRHEIESGTTSSINMQMVKLTGGMDSPEEHGLSSIFDSTDQTFEGCCTQQPQEKPKYITFVDTCGHDKYHRTTTRGLLSSSPDYLMLVISAENKVLPNSTQTYLLHSLLIGKPLMIALTKMDNIKIDFFNKLIRSLVDLLSKTFPNSSQTVINTLNPHTAKLTTNFPAPIDEIARDFIKQNLIVIFLCSSTSTNMQALADFLYMLDPNSSSSPKPKPKPKPISSLFPVHTGEATIKDTIQLSFDSLELQGNAIKQRPLKLLKPQCELLIERVYYLSGAGWVIVGKVMNGVLKAQPNHSNHYSRSANLNLNSNSSLDPNLQLAPKSQFFIGPSKSGDLISVDILSMHSRKVPITIASPGQLVSIVIGFGLGSELNTYKPKVAHSITGAKAETEAEFDYIQTETFRPNSFLKSGSFLVQVDSHSHNSSFKNDSMLQFPLQPENGFGMNSFNKFIDNKAGDKSAPPIQNIGLKAASLPTINGNCIVSNYAKVCTKFTANLMVIQQTDVKVLLECINTLYCGSIRQPALISQAFYKGKIYKSNLNAKTKPEPRSVSKPEDTMNKKPPGSKKKDSKGVSRELLGSINTTAKNSMKANGHKSNASTRTNTITGHIDYSNIWLKLNEFSAHSLASQKCSSLRDSPLQDKSFADFANTFSKAKNSSLPLPDSSNSYPDTVCSNHTKRPDFLQACGSSNNENRQSQQHQSKLTYLSCHSTSSFADAQDQTCNKAADDESSYPVLQQGEFLTVSFSLLQGFEYVQYNTPLVYKKGDTLLLAGYTTQF